MNKAICYDENAQICEPANATHLRISLPGPLSKDIYIPVQLRGSRRGTGNWSWNGDLNKVTLRPSLLTRRERTTGEVDVCHSWVTDGKVQFLADSTHEFAGQTLELL